MARRGRDIRFSWQPGRLSGELDRLDGKIRRAVEHSADYQAIRAEAYMKTNAPWTDRTSAARNGLFAVSSANEKQVRIVLAHLVNYGIWLEVANSGRYQVIMPSVNKIGADLMRQLNRVMARIK